MRGTERVQLPLKGVCWAEEPCPLPEAPVSEIESVCPRDRWVRTGERDRGEDDVQVRGLGQTPLIFHPLRLLVAWGLIHADQTDRPGL